MLITPLRNLVLLAGVVSVTLMPWSACLAVPLASEREIAAAALEALEKGDVEDAARRTRVGLESQPASVLLYKVAGTILMLTGDRAGSERAFQTVRTFSPADGLSAYALAVLRLEAGDMTAAEKLVNEALSNGDVGMCLALRQYMAYLRRPEGAAAPALPEPQRLARLGLEVAHAETRSDVARMVAAAEELLRDPSVNRYADYGGPLMTFDRRQPIRWSGGRIPVVPRVLPEPPSDGSVSGVVVLRANVTGAAYVAFRVDGQLVAVANTRPYTFNWNTASVPNGPHLVEVVAFDAHGNELSRERRTIVTSNLNAPQSSVPRGLTDKMWSFVSVRPSRASVAWLVARALARSGDAEQSVRWLWRACSVDPMAVPSEWHPRTTVRQPGAPLWSVRTEERLVALTFDDGPKPGITEEILDILSRAGVPATFFVIGRHVAAYPDLVQRLVQAGMEVANHSYSHPNLTRLTDDELRWELLKTSGCLYDITGSAPTWFRPPGGNLTERVVRVASSLGMRACMWTVNGEQKELEGSGPLLNHVLGQVRPGAVILLHNGRRTTVTALPVLINQLRQRGYRFVTLSELVARQYEGSEATVLQ